MKLIIWNCQGIGGDLTVDNLVEQNQLLTPDLMVMLETKNKSRRFDFLRRRLRMDFMHPMEPKGIRGGMCLFWRDFSMVTLVKSEEYVIEAKIWDGNNSYNWHLFAIYASTDERKRKTQWMELRKRVDKDRDRNLVI